MKESVSNKETILNTVNVVMFDAEGRNAWARNIVVKEQRKFMKSMNWDAFTPDGELFDEYDKLSSLNFAKFDQQNEKLLASFRLTRVEDEKQILSHAMLKKSPKAHEIIADKVHELRPAAENGSLYDLTRLISSTDGSVTKEEFSQSLAEMIGAAISATDPENDYDNYIWVFATTPSIKRMLENMGIIFETWASETIPGDKTSTHFCVAKPIESVKSVSRNLDLSDPVHASFVNGLMSHSEV